MQSVILKINFATQTIKYGGGLKAEASSSVCAHAGLAMFKEYSVLVPGGLSTEKAQNLSVIFVLRIYFSYVCDLCWSYQHL